MTFLAPPPADGRDDAGDPYDGYGEQPFLDERAPEGWTPLGEALDDVVQAADLEAVFAAERAVAVDRMRRLAIHEARAAGRVDTALVERSVRLELASALRVTESTAGSWMRTAEALVHAYPTVLEALGRARITERHANILIDLLDDVPAGERAPLVPRALDLAVNLPVGRFRRRLRALLDDTRAVTLDDRYRLAVARRRVCIEQTRDGMAWLSIHLPAVAAHAVFERVTAMAARIREHPDETRTLDQIRSDTVTDLVLHGDTATVPPEARGIRATVVVTVPALTLLTREPVPTGAGAVVEGVGPIPLATARELCGGATEWMRVLTHPETGMVLSVGRDAYRPPAALRRLIQWRADHCMAPGCSVPARRCDIDHNVPWAEGGHTALANHTPLCGGHHTVRHHGDWAIRHLEGGALEWTSPAGRVHLVEPERRVPTFTPAHAPPPF